MRVSPDALPSSVRAESSIASMQSQDELYRTAAAEFGPALARLAAAYEANRAQQEDLLQEIHLALWRSVASFRNRCSLRTWVYRVAHNIATTHVLRQKRARRLQLISLEELEAIPSAFDSERAADESAVLEQINAIVQQLKPIDRDVLLLYLEGLGAAEIADVVGISSNHAAQKVRRVKQVLQRHFRTGETHAPT
jgi:RNA polymerase sigma-70 factor (ECF subfamily)